MTPQTQISTATWGIMFLLACIWGGSFAAGHIALQELGPFTIVAMRVSIAAICLWLYAVATGVAIPRGLGIWLSLAIMGALNNALPFCLIVWGQKTIPSGLAGILNSATAIFGVLVAALVFPDEKLTPARLAGVVFGVAGVAVALGWENLSHLDLTSLSQLAVVGAALSYAVSGAFARVAFKGMRPQATALGMVTMSSLMMIPLAIVVEGVPTFGYQLQTYAAIGYISVLSTATAYVLMYSVLAKAGAGNLSLITLLVAPVAILLGALFFGEALQSSAYLGFGLLALGMLLLDGRVLKLFKPSTQNRD
jgi:drug/metabolite transporter (DMT)-like permease